MKTSRCLGIAAFMMTVGFAGCNNPPQEKPRLSEKATEQAIEDSEIKNTLAALGSEDQKLAEAQKYCAVESENRLGGMGLPVKVMVNDEPVFLCCKGCRKRALADQQKTLAKVKELKAKGAETPSKE